MAPGKTKEIEANMILYQLVEFIVQEGNIRKSESYTLGPNLNQLQKMQL